MRKPTGADPRKRKGLIIVHTGEGKGKSTAAFGLAMRAAGNKMNVFIMQFMKGPWKAGERKAFESLAPYVEVVPMGDGFTWDTENIEQDKATARKAFDLVKGKLNSGKFEMVIFEEINYVLDYKFLPEDEVLETIKNNIAKKGKSIPICFPKNINGLNKCDVKIFEFSIPVLFRA